MKRIPRVLCYLVQLQLLSLALLVAAATAPGGDLAHCAAITPADERLACYDTLVCGAIAAADERLACFDAVAKSRAARPPAVPAAAPPAAQAPAAPASAVPAPVAPAAAAGTATAPDTDPHSFGLAKPVAHTPVPAHGLDRIKAVVRRVDIDLQGGVRVALDNGQTWAFINYEESWLRPGEAVIIRRAALGSFLMTSASHHSYRVQRTQ